MAEIKLGRFFSFLLTWLKMSEIAAKFTALALREDLAETLNKPAENNNNVEVSPTKANDDQLRKLYRDPAGGGSFGGVDRLYKEAKKQGLKTSRKNVARYLSSETAHTLLHPQRLKFQRRQVETYAANFLWEV